MQVLVRAAGAAKIDNGGLGDARYVGGLIHGMQGFEKAFRGKRMKWKVEQVL